MAVTGKTATPIVPAFRPGRGRVIAVPEHSAQSFKKGCPALRSAGYLSAVSGLPQTIAGFTRIAAQNGASDGAKSASLYLAEPGATFKGTLRDTLAQTMRGAKALISVDASFNAFLTIATASSASYNAVIEGWSSEWTTDDVNPVVVFTVINTKIQGGN